MCMEALGGSGGGMGALGGILQGMSGNGGGGKGQTQMPQVPSSAMQDPGVGAGVQQLSPEQMAILMELMQGRQNNPSLMNRNTFGQGG